MGPIHGRLYKKSIGVTALIVLVLRKQAFAGIYGKNWVKILLATIGLAMQGTAGMAQSCDSYVGQSISPLTVSQASARVPNFQPKGEFETTADFETRKKVAVSAAAGPLFIGREPEDRKYFEYNADTQTLGIKKYVFANQLFEAWYAFYEVPSAKPLNV